jgi:hypothetical protein
MRPLLFAVGTAMTLFAIWSVTRRRHAQDLGSVSTTWINEHVADDLNP